MPNILFFLRKFFHLHIFLPRFHTPWSMYNKLLNNHQIIVKLITFAQNNEYQKFIELFFQRKEVAKKKEEVEKQKQETEKLKKKEKEAKELYLKELLKYAKTI